jgi:hypothetical protein
MLVSIIITSRDEDEAVLEATLGRLRESTRHLTTDTVIIDDGSRVPVRVPCTEARLVRNDQPLGVCPSRRQGACLAAGDVLVWLDAHMSFGASWLEQMLVHLDGESLLCSPFWSYDLRDCLCWGADFVWNSARDYNAQKYPGFGLRHRTDPPAHLVVDVPMVIGACYIMRRDAYERMGGFCPHFRIWGIDEQDMSARAWIAGFRVRCVTEAKVGHLCRGQFPYAVEFNHLEFNQMVMVRSIFGRRTRERIERHFDPLPPRVAEWLDQTDLSSWRAAVQRPRRMTDAEFLARFTPELSLD